MADQFTKFMQGLQMFEKGIKQYAATRAVNSAQEELSTLNTTEIDEAAKRQKQMAIAQNLAMNMVKAGADANDIQLASGSIMPKSLTQTDEWAVQSRQDQLNEAKANRAHQSAMADKRFQQAAALQGMKGQAPVKPSKGDLEFKTNVDVARKEANKLLKIIEDDGNFEVWNAENAATLDSAQYQLAINYAKIFDPESVAREGEVEAAKKYMIPLGAGTRNSVSKAAIKKYLERIRNYEKAREKFGNAAPPAESAESASASGDDIMSFLSEE
jgi:hypothetical protein